MGGVDGRPSSRALLATPSWKDSARRTVGLSCSAEGHAGPPGHNVTQVHQVTTSAALRLEW